MKIFLILTLLTCLAAAPSAYADELLETYVARLSQRDHFNSKGGRLTSAAAIIRQDRANFHKFGKRDNEDQSDKFFAKANNRALLEKFIERGKSTKAVLNQIIHGTPRIFVQIYRGQNGDYVNVTVLD